MMQSLDDNGFGFHSPLDRIRAKRLPAAELRQQAKIIRENCHFGFAQVMEDEADAVEVLEMKRFESNQRRKREVTISLSEENAFDVVDNLKVALRMYDWQALRELLEVLEDKLVDSALAISGEGGNYARAKMNLEFMEASKSILVPQCSQ